MQMTRQELITLADSLRRKALAYRGAGHIEGALQAEFEYREICYIFQKMK
jgi:hypothetical protein